MPGGFFSTGVTFELVVPREDGCVVWDLDVSELEPLGGVDEGGRDEDDDRLPVPAAHARPACHIDHIQVPDGNAKIT